MIGFSALIVICLFAIILLAVLSEETELVGLSSIAGFVLASAIIFLLAENEVESSKKGFKTWKKVEMVGNKIVDSTWYVVEKK